MKRTNNFRNVCAAAAILSIATLGLGATANAAVAPAAGVVSAVEAAPDYPQIDQDTASLTVHKHLQPEAAENSAGEQLNPAPTNKPVSGVEFTIQKIDGIDLKTNEGWQKAQALSKKFAEQGEAALTAEALKADGLSLGATDAKSTENGIVTFADKKLGLYLVKETNTADATVDDAKATIVSSKPFLVTLPMTHQKASDSEANNKTWNYDVHVYPKNSIVEVKKSVNDANKNVGDKVTYTLNTDVPVASPKGKALSKYVVMDKLSTHVSVTSEDVTVALKKVNAPGAAELSDPDDEFKLVGGDYNVVVVGSDVKVEFTPAGLAKLGKAAQLPNTYKVQTVITPTLKSVPVADEASGKVAGEIKNKAYLAPSSEYSDNMDLLPDPDTNKPVKELTPAEKDNGVKYPAPASDPVVTRLASIQINKFEANSPEGKLEGATFKLAYCPVKGEGQEATPEPTFLTVNDQSEWTTGDNGLVDIAGLHVNNFANNADETNNNVQGQTYCLYETKSPAGYELLTEPIKVQLNQAGEIRVLDVPNVKHNAGFQLPLTGANGLLTLGLAGAALAGGGALILVGRRRKAQD
ncbi:hypothetical protein BK816_01410 [Boudabousia tangfeifanii]|uniref:Gram-positive cocci surface proteins LPxTG domain-containing protein n=1 Tax=Boudabousia tangfeifanii TaxID=1912795 RepID=A0A1D9MII8_9ACTO|nr:SpaH/EbpB family LPXTG-anchored major pilin [Boudabousia tangfeifanii]AOZ72115.1 hypothetical protein BK816_01410 [Boudabousia tangfeifanii]